MLEFSTLLITVWKEGRAGMQLRLTCDAILLKDKKHKSKNEGKV